jgi:polar amino acid transport system substrate-binding protein
MNYVTDKRIMAMNTKSLLRGCFFGLATIIFLPLTTIAQTLERVETQGTLDVAFVKDAAPFSSAKNGRAEGYAIELCQRVADYLGTRAGRGKLDIKYTPTTVSGGLELIAQGDADILCGSVTDTLARRQAVSFSIPIYNGGIGALVSNNAPKTLTRVLNGEVAHEGPRWRATINQGLASHTFVVHQGTVTDDWVREQIAGLGVQAEVLTVTDHAEGARMVADGKADAYFADRAILSTQASTLKGVELLPIYYTYEPLALAVARGDEDMRLAVDTVLSQLYLSDEFEAMYARHFGQPGETSMMFFKVFARH